MYVSDMEQHICDAIFSSDIVFSINRMTELNIHTDSGKGTVLLLHRYLFLMSIVI